MNTIRVKVCYSNAIKNFIGKDADEIFASEGINLVQALGEISEEHPEIFERYKSGQLGLLLNGKTPRDSDVLQDGDEIRLVGMV